MIWYVYFHEQHCLARHSIQFHWAQQSLQIPSQPLPKYRRKSAIIKRTWPKLKLAIDSLGGPTSDAGRSKVRGRP
ncbi:hypothetical protein PoB_005247000 [Plakobranchus ocellatus]|uniref:Uncharacterized protein n=1 Tax=Plakobranchus ocellatus TaxID=259542 RepID=A0AAV4C3K1_9GAST|nr:hypothetical protein PoB_005247000 [Plakobranchus ocellatus]